MTDAGSAKVDTEAAEKRLRFEDNESNAPSVETYVFWKTGPLSDHTTLADIEKRRLTAEQAQLESALIFPSDLEAADNPDSPIQRFKKVPSTFHPYTFPPVEDPEQIPPQAPEDRFGNSTVTGESRAPSRAPSEAPDNPAGYKDGYPEVFGPPIESVDYKWKMFHMLEGKEQFQGSVWLKDSPYNYKGKYYFESNWWEDPANPLFQHKDSYLQRRKEKIDLCFISLRAEFTYRLQKHRERIIAIGKGCDPDFVLHPRYQEIYKWRIAAVMTSKRPDLLPLSFTSPTVNGMRLPLDPSEIRQETGNFLYDWGNDAEFLYKDFSDVIETEKLHRI